MLLANFFNLCFSSGTSPDDWRFSDIIPIPKPEKDPRDPLQNRCITIQCCGAKLYSSVLNNRLQNHLESHNILAEDQNDFRASRSCLDHIFVIITILRNRLALSKSTFLAFIDYKKAFDSVDRNMLFFKLLKLGVHGNFYKAITSLYLNPQSRVNLNGLYTNYFDCPLGVKQGDCLSPTLFAIFINDLAEEIRNSGLGVKLECGPLSSLTEVEIVSILLYADDIILLADSEADLQALLTIVENWCKRCRLEVNLSKTNVMHVRKKRTPQSRFVFLLNKQPVAYSSSYKYLGINIDEHLDIKYSVSCQSDAAGRALSVVVTKMIKNGGFPFKLYEMLYNSCVCSVADYTAPVTGYQEFESTMKLHLKAIRAYLGVPKNACNVGVLSEVNLILP